MKKKILLVAVVLVLVLVYFLINNLGPIVKKSVESFVPPVLKTTVEVGAVDISAFSGKGELTGVRVGNPEGYKTEYSFDLKDMEVDVDVTSVTSDKIVVNEIKIIQPHIIYEGDIGKSNISKLIENASSYSKSEPGKEESPARESTSEEQKVQINHLLMEDVKVSLSMKVLGGKKMTLTLPKIEMNDIGKENDASIADVMKEVLGSINKSIIPAIQKGLFKGKDALIKTGGALKEGGKNISGGAKEGINKLKGLFKKE